MVAGLVLLTLLLFRRVRRRGGWVIQIKGSAMAKFRYKSNERQGDQRKVVVEFLTDDGATITERPITITAHDSDVLTLVVNEMGAALDKDDQVRKWSAGWNEMETRMTAAEAAAATELQRQQQAAALDEVLNRHIADGTVLETTPTA